MNEKLLRPKDAAEFLAISVSSLYEYAKRPDFPKRRKVGLRAVGWWMSELKEWVDRKSEKSAS